MAYTVAVGAFIVAYCALTEDNIESTPDREKIAHHSYNRDFRYLNRFQIEGNHCLLKPGV